MIIHTRMQVSQEGTINCFFSLHGTNFVPYRIDNCSSQLLHIQQEGCLDQEEVLRPYSSLPYVWDEPSRPHRLLLLLPGRRKLQRVDMDAVGTVRELHMPPSKKTPSEVGLDLFLAISAEGPIRVLVVLDGLVHPARHNIASGFSWGQDRAPREKSKHGSGVLRKSGKQIRSALVNAPV